MCEWNNVEKLYDGTVRSLIRDTKQMCPKCVFNSNNTILDDVYNRRVEIPDAQADSQVAHRNFV